MQKTILVVDDFENSLFVIGFTIAQKGYKVLKAKSGQEALEHLSREAVDLLITDYHMPQMNGLQLVEKIKRSSRYQKMPVFILSTETQKELKEKAAKLGVTAWIKKPFEIIKLVKLIERVI